MSVSPVWHTDDKLVIRMVHEGIWTWDEFHHALRELDTMLNSVLHTVDLIIDVRNSANLPAGTPSQLGKINEFYKHPHLGHSVVVGANNLVKVFVNIMTSVYPPLKQRFQLAESIDEAIETLRQRRKQQQSSTESNKK
jgi:hypothetical protein